MIRVVCQPGLGCSLSERYPYFVIISEILITLLIIV